MSGVPVGNALGRLHAANVIASATPYNPSYLRFGATIANSEAEVDAAVRAVAGLV